MHTVITSVKSLSSCCQHNQNLNTIDKGIVRDGHAVPCRSLPLIIKELPFSPVSIRIKLNQVDIPVLYWPRPIVSSSVFTNFI